MDQIKNQAANIDTVAGLGLIVNLLFNIDTLQCYVKGDQISHEHP